jgi:cellulose synthase/poly-beta-1,6-N-acetylglucosamine synthase-like glycosyltransferase
LESINLDQYDAIFIIDADSMLMTDVLKELNRILGQRKDVIQCYNGVANPDESWFTRLLNVSRTIGNEIYHPAKQKLGLSSYLMGNGMCFSTKLLLKYGWEAFSVGEDWEYYAKLIQEGETVAFAYNARVYHQESSSLKQATSQRMRWSGGRFAIARKYGFGLLYRGLIERNFKKIDASFPFIFPNPSLGMNITAIGFVLSFLVSKAFNSNIFVLWFCFLLLIQFGIFLIGIGYTKDKLKNFAALFFAPLFLAWKMGIDIFSIFGMGRKKWVRTKRKF